MSAALSFIADHWPRLLILAASVCLAWIVVEMLADVPRGRKRR